MRIVLKDNDKADMESLTTSTCARAPSSQATSSR
ncbi:hypothetical protein [Faecalibaculum rodentium]|nr:hypothetical protein [Faecalibaculum rodentium]